MQLVGVDGGPEDAFAAATGVAGIEMWLVRCVLLLGVCREGTYQ